MCKLKKALYGLKRPPQDCYRKLIEYLNFCGSLVLDSNSSLFVKKQVALHVIILLYVDDIIITGNDNGEVKMLQDELSIWFEIKDLDELHYFLGLEVINMKDEILLSRKTM